MQYTVAIEKEENTCYGAYVPDFPGAIGVGDTREEAIESVRKSILLLLEYDQERNEPHAEPRLQTETIMGYLVVIDDDWEDEDSEEADSACRAYVPGLPDCVGVGVTREEAVERVRESMRLYVVEAHRKGLPVPPPGEWTETIEIAAPNASAASAESFSTKGKRGARRRWADRPQLWGAVLADLERGLSKPEAAVACGVSLRSVQEIARRAGVSRPAGRPRRRSPPATPSAQTSGHDHPLARRNEGPGRGNAPARPAMAARLPQVLREKRQSQRIGHEQRGRDVPGSAR